MSKENVELVRASIDAYRTGARDSYVDDFFAEDVEVCPNVICLSPFPCLHQAIRGNSGQFRPRQCCFSSEAAATLRPDAVRCSAPRTREEASAPGCPTLHLRLKSGTPFDSVGR